jgi:hypothetical protein
MLSRFLIVCWVCFICLTSCDNKQKTTNEIGKEEKSANGKTVVKEPFMDFQGKNIADLGTINEGEIKKHTFEFVNTGTAPLQISYANASCGCTVPAWPKNAIPVGGKGAITVEFNSKNKSGKLYKTVSIYANTKPEFTTVAFNVEVLEK